MCPQTLTSVEMGKKDPSEMTQGAGIGRAKLERGAHPHCGIQHAETPYSISDPSFYRLGVALSPPHHSVHSLNWLTNKKALSLQILPPKVG